MRIQSTVFYEAALENSLHVIKRGIALTSVIMAMVILHPGEAFPQESDQDIPQEYQDKQMPSGWLTDPQVLAAGKAIYEGKTNPHRFELFAPANVITIVGIAPIDKNIFLLEFAVQIFNHSIDKIRRDHHPDNTGLL